MRVNQTSLIAHVYNIVGERHPDTSPLALQRTVSYITDEWNRIGLDVFAQPFEAPSGEYYNVIAELKGEDQKKAPLIVAAHYDTVAGSPGADDNASSVAALLEVSRVIKDVPLSRTVRFIAFGLEEGGLYGSRAYVKT